MTLSTINSTKLKSKKEVRKVPTLNPRRKPHQARMRRLTDMGRAFYAGDYFVSSGRWVYAKGSDGGYGVLVGSVKQVWPEVYA